MNTHIQPVRGLQIVIAVVAALVTAGCATTYISTDATQNPPPEEAFASFQHFKVSPIKMGPPYAGQPANDKALVKIQENFDLRVNSLLDSWNSKATSDAGRTLLIEPRVKDIKFINATSRFWGGAMAGSSAVVLSIRFSDEASGAVIAEPEFFQRAAAMGGAWTFGATDNNMLVRIAELASAYIKDNYHEAVGGPTGAPEPK